MKYRERTNGKNGWTSIAIAGAAIIAAAFCGSCLYTASPAMGGSSTTSPQSANSQPAAQPSPTSQPSNDQTNQNKQQNGMPPNGAQPQGQGGTL